MIFVASFRKAIYYVAEEAVGRACVSMTVGEIKLDGTLETCKLRDIVALDGSFMAPQDRGSGDGSGKGARHAVA